MGAAVRKYGARSHTAALTSRRPGQDPERRRHVPSTLGVLTGHRLPGGSKRENPYGPERSSTQG
ncbi:hypothetical protein GCM10023204_48860 [Actinomycetospora succinea]